MCELLRIAGWNGLPIEEVGDEREQRVGRRELRARRGDVAVEVDDLSRKFAVLPQAERSSVGVEQIRQRPEFLPLRFVMSIGEASRIGTFARCLHLDEADKRLGSPLDTARYGEIRAGSGAGERGFADEADLVRRHTA
ncbi:hypothetical protein [Mesorhizobium sp. J428]|uniref:hypothetical protein n=1 Tax=Mesorhizobium sp. J428 TaxID=2898440 RepID=UPI0027E35E0A|nr:hypothetical protein [Mesorhizobium sp. J428]